MKFIFNALLLLVPVGLMVACAAPPRYDYFKAGASPFERTSALSECEYQIKLNKTAAANQSALLKLCMEGKDYRYKIAV